MSSLWVATALPREEMQGNSACPRVTSLMMRDLTLHSALGVVSLEMSALPRELTLVTLTSGETALPRVLGPVTGLTGQGRMVSDVAWCVSGGTLSKPSTLPL